MIGTSNTVERTVGEGDLACTVGSGDLEVLATPVMIAMMEEAACRLLGRSLDGSQSSVGTRMDVMHTAPTPRGMKVTATATLTGQEGRRFDFTVTAGDERGEIGGGTHSRVVVDATRFQRKADAKLGEKQ